MTRHSSILLIDDSPGERELFALALAQTGLNVPVHGETNAKAALHFLDERFGHQPLPSLVLLDLKLCGSNGGEFLRRVRLDTRFAHLPVILFTTSDDASDVRTSYANGANGYVVKPGTFDELVRCVRDLCAYWLHWNETPAMVESRC